MFMEDPHEMFPKKVHEDPEVALKKFPDSLKTTVSAISQWKFSNETIITVNRDCVQIAIYT